MSDQSKTTDLPAMEADLASAVAAYRATMAPLARAIVRPGCSVVPRDDAETDFLLRWAETLGATPDEARETLAQMDREADPIMSGIDYHLSKINRALGQWVFVIEFYWKTRHMSPLHRDASLRLLVQATNDRLQHDAWRRQYKAERLAAGRRPL